MRSPNRVRTPSLITRMPWALFPCRAGWGCAATRGYVYLARSVAETASLTSTTAKTAMRMTVT